MRNVEIINKDVQSSLATSNDSDADNQRDVAFLRLGYYGRKRCHVIRFSTGPTLNGLPKAGSQMLRKYHLTYKFARTECKLVRNILHAFGFTETHSGMTAFNLLWAGGHVKPFEFKALEPHQKTNHFPRSFELTRKDRLYKNIQAMQQLKGRRHFDFIPTNFALPAEMDAFQAEFAKERGFWIVKPVASSRGRGIYLINSVKQITSNDQVLVCKYIASPLLIDGFKFDCRIYVAVTCFDPLTVYVYEEGLARFSTIRYKNTQNNIKNLCMHLTNYSINKVSKDYVRCENPDVEDYGNKWSFSALLQYLAKIGKDTTALMSQIEDVIVKTFLAGEASIASAYNLFVGSRGNCFELFGFDILIDDNMKPWLLEVNLSPSLACDSPMDLKIKSNLMVDLFNLTGFVLQDPSEKKQTRSRAPSASLGRHTRSSSATTRQPLNTTARLEYSVEEKQILRETKEEYQNRGRFIRVYPTPESWRLYGHLHTHYSTKNKTLHTMLFPELWEVTRKPDLLFETRHFPRAASRNNSLTHGNKVVGSLKNGLAFSQRYKCYERKLISETAPASIKLSSSANASSFHHSDQQLSLTTTASTGGNENLTSKPYERVLLSPDNGNISKSPEDCRDYVVNKAMHLTPYQARVTFSTYLERVQHRLLQQCSPQAKHRIPREDVERHSQQIELVQHFLDKASANLYLPVQEKYSQHDISLQERRRSLARQLRDFLRCYSAVTERDFAEDQMPSLPTPIITAHHFQVFAASASEATLESVLTSFTKNKNMSSVFFGEKTDSSCSSATELLHDGDCNVPQRRRLDRSRSSVTLPVQKGITKRRPISASVAHSTTNPGAKKPPTQPAKDRVTSTDEASYVTDALRQLDMKRSHRHYAAPVLAIHPELRQRSNTTESDELRVAANLMRTDTAFENLLMKDRNKDSSRQKSNLFHQSAMTQTDKYWTQSSSSVGHASTVPMHPHPPENARTTSAKRRHFYKQRLGTS